MNEQERHRVSLLRSNDAGLSVWGEASWRVEVRGQLFLSPQIAASSLRLRRSEPGYAVDWHVSQEPVLIVATRGVLRIGTRDGVTRDFGPAPGLDAAFIAADRLRDGETFDDAVHGHTSRVIGDEPFEAVHVKLDAFDPDHA